MEDLKFDRGGAQAYCDAHYAGIMQYYNYPDTHANFITLIDELIDAGYITSCDGKNTLSGLQKIDKDCVV